MADDTLGGQLDNLGNEARQAQDAFQSIGSEIRNIKRDLGDSSDLFRNLTLEISQGYRNSQKLAEATQKVKDGTASTKILQRQASEQIAKQKQLQDKVAELMSRAANETGSVKDNLLRAAQRTADAADHAGHLANGFRETARANAELDKNAQFFDRMSKLVSQIPGLGKLSGSFNEAAAAIRKANLEGKEGVEKLRQGFDIIGKASLVLIAQQLLKLSTEVNNFQKNLNLSYVEALLLKKEFAAMSFESGDVAVNSIRIAEANAEMNAQLGTAAVFSGELLTTFSKLTKIAGLSSEAAGSLAQQALISGQEFRTVEENALGASYALQRSSGVALNNKEILEATGKVTGQVRANLGSNPALIAEAVTKAKLLGAELKDIEAVSKSLLQFESSIGAELEAELLTGKQLNLERARALSLQGDLAGVADEIARQNINFAEFGKMNVLQQEALAKAVGMTADGLADMLMKQEAQGRTAKELRAIGKGELADRLEVLDAQERIALATEKLQVALSSVLTPLVPIVDLFAMIAGSTEVVYTLLGATIPLLAIVAAKQAVSFAKSIGKSVAEIFGGSVGALGPLGIPIAIAGVGAMMGLIASSMTKADDMMYGDNMLITKDKGAIALNNEDTIIAGTDLFGGKKVESPKESKPIIIDNTKVTPPTNPNPLIKDKTKVEPPKESKPIIVDNTKVTPPTNPNPLIKDKTKIELPEGLKSVVTPKSPEEKNQNNDILNLLSNSNILNDDKKQPQNTPNPIITPKSSENVSSGISDEQIGKLISGINSKKVVFDSFTSSGPQAFVETERRRPSNLFF